MGFIKSIKPEKITGLKSDISKPVGLFWLLSTIQFLITIYFLLTVNSLWWIVCGSAIVISQIVIILSWRDAKFGTILNIALSVLIYSSVSF
jgi:hypothetical protein